MSVNPVDPSQPSSDPIEIGSAAKNASGVERLRAGVNPGTDPKKERHPVTLQEDYPLQVQDAVQVQREGQDHIIIKYFDRTGRVILQVPSSQLLGLQKAIERALDDQERNRTVPDNKL
jgi:hypothetical protein